MISRPKTKKAYHNKNQHEDSPMTRTLTKLSPSVLLLTYLILSAVPLTAMLMHEKDPLWLDILRTEIALWIAIWACFKKPRYFHICLLPAFLIMPFEIYVLVNHGQAISSNHLGIIVETNPMEAREFLGKNLGLLIIVEVLMLAWFGFTWRLACLTDKLDWLGKTRLWALILVVAAIVLVGVGKLFGVYGSDERFETPISGATTLNQTPHKKTELIFMRSWPFGFVTRITDFISERKRLATLAERNRHFTFGAHAQNNDAAPQIYVVVIGESSRYDRWSLNGYQRETNPNLKKIPNLLSFSDVITPAAATRVSVPIILTRKTALQSLDEGFSEKSFLTAFKEAGFTTYWLSNQAALGLYDTPISVFAKEADHAHFLNMGSYTVRSNLDQILLPALQQALAAPSQKKLIVLHTLGSHWNYSHRHPQEFSQWQPTLPQSIESSYDRAEFKTAMSNSYDNSILYTDWFLAQIIAQLKSTKQVASMLYISDHGETLYDGECTLALHGNATQFEAHIPALLWYSDRYEQTFPLKVANLKNHRDAKLSTENVFHTLLDIADIRYADERLAWSIAHPTFRQHQRYFDALGMTDYDNSKVIGDCRRVKG
jgi:glucan phosphoethanolaminetransferase (alkaline phosphatase superfamily)